MLIQRRRLLGLLTVICVLTFLFYPKGTNKKLVKIGDLNLSTEQRCNEFFNDFASTGTKTNFYSKNINEIRQMTQNIRLYANCFIRHNITPNFDLKLVEKKVFPVFSVDQLNDIKTQHQSNPASSSMFGYFGNGRGIALSFGSHQVNDFKRLLSVLSVNNNSLPIEVIYKGDLRPSDISLVLKYAKFYNQRVAFVDVENRIVGEHFSKFSRFANKWLAAIFNSFEEFILIDADVVPFVDLELMFESKGFKSTRSYMFRDRAVSNEFLTSSVQKMYRDLLPSEWEVEMFDLPPAGQRLRLMNKFRHHVESGVVVMNKQRYLPGLLMGFALQMWEKTSMPVWGDKELFWMGQSIAGEEGYFVSERFAGTIGQLKRFDGSLIESIDEKVNTKNSMVCSIHPAHFDEHNRLVWVNSGLSNCKFGTFDNDYNKYFKNMFESPQALREHYADTLLVNAAIIPPRLDLGIFEKTKRKLFKGFQMRHDLGCSGYVWCAYDTPSEPGLKILFDEQELDHINLVKQAWKVAV